MQPNKRLFQGKSIDFIKSYTHLKDVDFPTVVEALKLCAAWCLNEMEWWIIHLIKVVVGKH